MQQSNFAGRSTNKLPEGSGIYKWRFVAAAIARIMWHLGGCPRNCRLKSLIICSRTSGGIGSAGGPITSGGGATTDADEASAGGVKSTDVLGGLKSTGELGVVGFADALTV